MGNKRILFYFFMMIFFGLIIIASPVYAKEVDVALFWGQSNMVGAGTRSVENGNIINFDNLDGRIFEYKYRSDSLIEYSKTNNIPDDLGENYSIKDSNGATTLKTVWGKVQKAREVK